jgi:molybdenum cofactor synthesis domain-containing protein
MLKTAVLTISDKCHEGKRKDKSGKTIIEIIRTLPTDIIAYDVVPDDIDVITEKLIHYCDILKADFVLTTGGTGFSKRDVTPEATKKVIDKETQGISEGIRIESLKITHKAMLSRAVSGIRGETLIINFPGSPKAVCETLEIVMPILTHAHDMIHGKGH